VARAGLAVAVLAAVGWAAHRGVPTSWDLRVVRLIIPLPESMRTLLGGVLHVGTLVAVAGIGGAAALAGRHRLALVVVVAGSAAWAAKSVVQWLVDEDVLALGSHPVVLRGGVTGTPGLAFPAGEVAVAAAIAIVAAPYIGRSTRWVCGLVVGWIAVALVFLGPHLPTDVIGGLTLGVAVGAIVNVALGTPVNGPSIPQLSRLLESSGLRAVDIEDTAAPDHWRGRTADGQDYLIKTLSWDRLDQRWLSFLWRLVAYRQVSAPITTPTPSHQTEHEAHISLLAERSGVRTPALVVARAAGHHRGLIVRRWIDASPLSELSGDALADAVLVDAWRQLAAVHRAGIVHRRLHPSHLLIDRLGQVWLVGWGNGCVDIDQAGRDADLAEMAVALASRAGPDRTVRTASETLGPSPVTGMLGGLQMLALGPLARDLAAKEPGLLPALRHQVAALDGREAPTPPSPTRLAVKNLAPVVALALAVYILLPRLARSSTSLATLRHADWLWLAVVAAGSALTYVAAATALMAASGQRLSFRRTYAVQLAAASTNRVVPAGLGAIATNMRYLELEGLDRPGAVAAIGLTTGTGFAVHLVATIAAVLLLRSRAFALHVPDFDATWPDLLALGAAGAAIGWLGWARKLHVPVLRWLRATRSSIGGVVVRPARLAVLVAGSAGISAAYILALTAALAAYGARPGLGTVAGVYLASSAVASVAPTPGGIGPFEAAAVAGLGALGVKPGPAVAAVITYRLITYWLPVIPGVVALHVLRRRKVL
jgi:uncharacterized membrane protein YbhN (UPF0104 family)/membrane-associated phospholipid phosphatase/tRNA A-37 threonylcarbamoyl transferase component Bud32